MKVSGFIGSGRMKVWVVMDDCYDRNIICVTTDRKIADKAFDDHNAELVAKGFRPNTETDRMCLIEQYEVVELYSPRGELS